VSADGGYARVIRARVDLLVSARHVHTQGEVQLERSNTGDIMKTNSKTQAGVKVNSAIKAGGIWTGNHARKALGLSVKSGVKAGEGIYAANHSRRLS
jgi:hypothetical protein